MNKRIFTVKVFIGKKCCRYRRTTSSKRIFSFLGTINFKTNGLKVYVRVNYGNGFINEGYYFNKHDLLLAVNAFNEKGL